MAQIIKLETSEIPPNDKQIEESLLHDDDRSFNLKNGGITISVDKWKIIDQGKNGKLVELYFDNDDEHGINNGGHTYHAIIKNQNTLKEFNSTVFVTIYILSKVDDMITDISSGLNTNVQVKDYSLANQKKQFEDLKRLIEYTALNGNISFSENDGQKLVVKDLIALLKAFDHKHHDNYHPAIGSYSAKGQLTKTYIREMDAGNDPYDSIKPHLPKIIGLVNHIESTFGKMYNNSTGGKFGGCSGIQTSPKGTEKFTLKFDPAIKTKYWITESYLWPAWSAMRALLEYDENTNSYSWKADPFKVWNDVGEHVIKSIMTPAKEFKSPNKIGKSGFIWIGAYNAINAVNFKS